jgi:hypothetical protein
MPRQQTPATTPTGESVTENEHSVDITSDTGPFAIIPEWVITSTVSHGAVRLYALLARYADYTTGRAFPSRKTLATRLGTSSDTVDRFVKELIEIEAIEVRRRSDGKAYTSNLYIVKRVKGDRTDATTGRTDAATPDRTDATRGDRTSAELTRTSKREPTDREISTSHSVDVERVFVAWIESTGRDRSRTKLDSKRRRCIEWALKTYPLDDVLSAVDGWRHSAFHRGENEAGKCYNDITLILRNSEKIEYFRDRHQNPDTSTKRGVTGTWQRLAQMMGDDSD